MYQYKTFLKYATDSSVCWNTLNSQALCVLDIGMIFSIPFTSNSVPMCRLEKVKDFPLTMLSVAFESMMEDSVLHITLKVSLKSVRGVK